MQEEEHINKKIMDITLVIQDKYPELLKYLIEIPITIPTVNHPEINLKTLQEYHETLTSLLENYILEHPAD